MRDRLKVLRKSLGLSQERFGARLSLSGGYVAELELGRKPINERIQKLICLTFNVNADWLKNGEGEMLGALSREERILDGFNRLSPEFQDFIARKIDELLEIQRSVGK